MKMFNISDEIFDIICMLFIAVLTFIIVDLTYRLICEGISRHNAKQVIDVLTVDIAQVSASTIMVYHSIGKSGILTPITRKKIKIRTVEYPKIIIESDKDLILTKGDKIKVLLYIKDNNIIDSKVL